MNIIAFCCENSVNDLNAENVVADFSLRDVKFIKLPCSGRIDVLHIIKAFEQGTDGVLIFGCHEGACKFINGNIKTKKRLDYAKKILKEIGIDGNKLQMHNVQINQEEKLKEIIQNFKNEMSGGIK